MASNYVEYFDIDPDYFPTVNAALIETHPDMWKKFFPHKTFVGLLHNVVDVLARKEKLSIWGEGAYGTGKSHAVLTLKRLLDSSEDEMRAYFDKNKNELSNDLFDRLTKQKNDGRILTVHRYGSSAIIGDRKLVFAIQDSIVSAMKEAGIENKAQGTLRDAIISWLSVNANKNYFNEIIKEHYGNRFGGKDVDALIHDMKSYEGDALTSLADQIMEVADNHGVRVMQLEPKGLAEWIKEVIKVNGLKAIIFIWDEFTEYFLKNQTCLTGLQEIAELSNTAPFHLVIVTHMRQDLFQYLSQNAKKIEDRFIKPTCRIELPANMALQLMGRAMKITDDAMLSKEWLKKRGGLASRTHGVRKMIQSESAVKITDEEFDAILPIHPYAAILLRNIAAAFQANQRSMFDFIKNDKNDDGSEQGNGFKWFIKNRKPSDPKQPFLSIDLLWDFFYEKGRDSLTDDIRAILDSFARTRDLFEDEQRVLKTILMLQAISRHSGDSVSIFATTKKNIYLAFEGSDLEREAANCADKLVRDGILFMQTIGNEEQYSVLTGGADAKAIEKEKERIRENAKTSRLAVDGELESTFKEHIVGAVKLRYEIRICGADNFDQESNKIRGQCEQITAKGKIPALVVVARDEMESFSVETKLTAALAHSDNGVVYIDATNSTMGPKDFDRYVDHAANAAYWHGKDKMQAQQYASNASKIIKEWCAKIISGNFSVSYRDQPSGDALNSLSIEQLIGELQGIDKKKYPLCLEGAYSVINNMYEANSIPLGAECGVGRSTKGTFKSANQSTKLEKAFKEAWSTDRYWEIYPHILISKIKIKVDEMISAAFDSSGRISIREIYDELKAAPYGLMPCNLTAFVLGFVLKEYVDGGKYTYSDGTNSDVLDLDHLKEMIRDIIGYQNSPSGKYRDKYIVALTDEQKAFNEATSTAFDIPKNLCTSVEHTRGRIIEKMRQLTFPIWCLKHIFDMIPMKTGAADLSHLIDLYIGLANTHNMGGAASESNIANNIGAFCISHKEAADDLKKLLTSANCTAGMEAYLKAFKGGELITLANEIGGGGEYIDALRKRFEVDAATWLWNHEEADKRICEVILDYQVITESSKIIGKSISIRGCVADWIDKCDNIKVSFEAARNYLDDIKPLLSMLHTIKKTGELRDGDKANFLEMLKACGRQFGTFYTQQGQLSLFKRVCSLYIEDLQDDDIREIFDQIPRGIFTYEAKDYLKKVEEIANDHKTGQVAEKLRKYWRDKTSTPTPREWSKHYRMPILCMVSSDEFTAAHAAFETLNKKRPNEGEVKSAMGFFEGASELFDRLNDEAAREDAFSKHINAKYGALISNDEVREAVSKRLEPMGIEPYDWQTVAADIDDVLKPRAQNKYTVEGADKALKVIDDMSTEDAKRYLRDLVKDNMIVGIEIIKSSEVR